MALVVNNDPLVRAQVASVLAEAGYVVFTAGDKEEALALARTLDDQLGSLWSARSPDEQLQRS